MADNVRNFTVNSLQQFYNKLNTDILPSYATYSYVQAAYAYIINEIIDNEYVIAQTFNTHNDRLIALETAGYITEIPEATIDRVIDETSYNAASSYAVAKALNDTEYAVGMSLNDLNGKIENVGETIDGIYERMDGFLPIFNYEGGTAEGIATGLSRGSQSVTVYLDGEFDPEFKITGNSNTTILNTEGLLFRSNSFVAGKGYTNSTDYNTSSILYKPTGKDSYTLSFPEKSGTFALTSDIPTGLATETYVTNKVAGIVNSAPETLDTLNELAAALGNDPNFATTVSTDIGTKVSKTELAGLGYVTQTTLSNQSYVTTTVLSNQSYVTTTALNSRLNSAGYISSFTETDPTVPSYVKSITQANINAWNSYANVQADWDEYDSTNPTYIKNKPETYWGRMEDGGVYSAWIGPAFASGSGSFAVGSRADAEGDLSLAIGNFVSAFGDNSQAFGFQTTAYAPASHAEGNYVHAFGIGSHAEGLYITTGGQGSHGEGGSKYSYYLDTSSSTLEGITTYWMSINDPADKFNFAGGDFSHAEGFNTLTSGVASHAEGGSTYAIAAYTHAEGWSTFAAGERSHSEGTQTVASGNYSHAEGSGTTASGEASHAEGGWYNVAGGACSHSEGSVSKAYGNYTHAEGTQTVAYAEASHAEGRLSYTIGNYSHGEGFYTYTYNVAEHAEGQYNQSHKANATFGNAGNTIHSIGIGTGTSTRKNALEIMQNGNAYFINVGNYNGSTLTSAKPLHTVLNEKQDTISDLATIRSNASAGAAKVSNVQADWNTSSSSDQSYIKNKPTIPAAVTESTVSGWGFTKNAAANNTTITIKKGSYTGTFTTNANTAKTINLPNELPSYSSADSGKILSVNSSGQLVWITPVSIYTGSGEPNNANGNDGDIYLQS